jgi:ribonuclease BN (tRNA processing enzyme)
MIELIMVGTGSGFSKKYYNNNALFNLNGYRLLVDCGHTAHRSLNELGLSWNHDIDGILITHIHADHVGGLEEVALDGKQL